ncbi:hypothetical cytosolic protein [Syntrophus aciditrophicus SB]|uniref:Hypothetical cytosolic protein n=1 Tax=Syntrophus aciditrophicus (strain SB) TaxID=56780 RepID=Q2LYG3_SYNAS|nr:hypothetical cytosolic protein [Syntrophus aciditrophicus SB]
MRKGNFLVGDDQTFLSVLSRYTEQNCFVLIREQNHYSLNYRNINKISRLHPLALPLLLLV